MVTRGGGVAGWGGGARVWPLEPLAPAAAKVTVGCSRRTCRESHRRRWQFWHCLVVHRLPAVGLCDAAGCNGAPGRWASGSAAGGFAFAFRAELVLLVWAADVPSAGDQFILRTHSPIRHGHAVGRERGGAAESQDRRWVRRARGRPWHSAGRSSCNSEPASLQVGFLAMFRALSRARCCVLCEV